MSGFGEQRHHGTYDDVAAGLGAAARRLAAPLATVARKRALKAQGEAARNGALVKTTETELHIRQVRAQDAVAASPSRSAERR